MLHHPPRVQNGTTIKVHTEGVLWGWIGFEDDLPLLPCSGHTSSYRYIWIPYNTGIGIGQSGLTPSTLHYNSF
jgi:hypothetical protein